MDFMKIVANINNYLLWVERIPSADLIAFTSISLTILIPLFITQISNESEKRYLDLLVILDETLNFKLFLTVVIISLLSAVVLNIQITNFIRLILLAACIGCNIYIAKKIFDFYAWIKGAEKNNQRLVYLKKISKRDELEKVYESIWSGTTTDVRFEDEILNIFMDKINFLEKSKNFKAASGLLTGFRDNFANRNEGVLLFNYLPKAFDLWLKLSKKLQVCEEKKELDTSLEESIYTLWQTITDIEKIAIKNNLTPFFYQSLKNFTNRLEKDEVSIIENLYNQICKTLFDEITTKEITDDVVFNGFPKEWKITIDTVKPTNSFEDEPKNVFPFFWFRDFFKWIQFRVHEKNQTLFDQQAELVSDNLFPDIYKSILSNFLIVLFSYGKGDPAKWIIETEWSFGKVQVIGAFRPISSDRATAEEIIELEYENLKQKTYSLIAPLIENRWCRLSKESIIKLLEQLKTVFENLKFEEKTIEEAKRLEYLEMINEVLKRLKGEN